MAEFRANHAPNDLQLWKNMTCDQCKVIPTCCFPVNDSDPFVFKMLCTHPKCDNQPSFQFCITCSNISSDFTTWKTGKFQMNRHWTRHCSSDPHKNSLLCFPITIRTNQSVLMNLCHWEGGHGRKENSVRKTRIDGKKR